MKPENSNVQATEGGTTKKQYNTPDLVEYGTVAKLTQGGGTSGGDPRRTRTCL